MSMEYKDPDMREMRENTAAGRARPQKAESLWDISSSQSALASSARDSKVIAGLEPPASKTGLATRLDEAVEQSGTPQFKPPSPVSPVDDEILKRARERGRLQESTGDIALHPETGKPLLPPERYYANYVDEMPRKHVPEYLESGYLVPGIYRMSFEEFAREFGNNTHRRILLANFEDALQGLRQGNVKTVHVGGSYVTMKSQPHDIDFLWDKLADNIDFSFLRSHRYGSLLHHSSHLLKGDGLQMMITPPKNGTYKGMQYFFSRHAAPSQATRRVSMRTLPPNGIVELDLTTLPARALATNQDIAS